MSLPLISIVTALLTTRSTLAPEILPLEYQGEQIYRTSHALIVADNADWSADYLARVRSKAEGYMSVPFAEDVELSMRVIT